MNCVMEEEERRCKIVKMAHCSNPCIIEQTFKGMYNINSPNFKLFLMHTPLY